MKTKPKESTVLSQGMITLLVMGALGFMVSCSEQRQKVDITVHTTDKSSRLKQYSHDMNGEVVLPGELPSLSEILDLNNEITYAERMEVIHALYAKKDSSPKLSLKQIELLESMVLTPNLKIEFPQSKLTKGQENAFKNDILNALLFQRDYHSRLLEVLGLMRKDPKQNLVMRDYALQFIAAANEGNQIEEVIYEAHWDTIKNRGETQESSVLAATSMLHLLSANDLGKLNDTEKLTLQKAAYDLANDKDAPSSARITALQVCGKLELGHVRELALSLSNSKATEYHLRIAAIATLGDLDYDSATNQYLHQLVLGNDRRLRKPAISALSRIQKRLENNQS